STVGGRADTTFMEVSGTGAGRKGLVVKYNSRAGDKNLDVLKNLLAQRQHKAKLLGFPTYAAYIASDRMVKTTSTVWDFENKLVEQVKEKTRLDIKELLEVKRKHINNSAANTINYWEASFYSNKLLVDKYQVDQEKVKEYFALNNVIDGLFQVTQKLFGVTYIEVKDPSVWH